MIDGFSWTFLAMMLVMMMMMADSDFVDDPDEPIYPVILPNIIFIFMLIFTILFFIIVLATILYCLFRPGTDEDERLNLMLKNQNQPLGQQPQPQQPQIPYNGQCPLPSVNDVQNICYNKQQPYKSSSYHDYSDNIYAYNNNVYNG